ncbi:MAG TPA: sigma-70 family RNA polymerase sigma factor [Polyangiaceae bacterium]|nr:sigma-70 family RNA polymerase sigma factor [Polyangiaceae bacterium]
MSENAVSGAISINSLDAYRRAISRYHQLTAEEERELARRYRAGDRRAGDRLIQACLPFVLLIAREYRCWGVPPEDIVQQGNLGLLKAAFRFDPDRECRLVTYAAYWVRAEIREYVVRGYRMVRLGTTKGERRALRAFRKTHETDPARLAEMSGLSPAAVEQLMPLLAGRDVSVDAPTAAGATVLDRIASNDATPEDRAMADERTTQTRAEIESFLKELPARERTILRERWLSDSPVTLQRLGERFGISKERVRQLEERTIAKLRGRLLATSGLAEAC